MCQAPTCHTRVSSLVVSADGSHAAYKLVEGMRSFTSFTSVLILQEAVGGLASVFGESVNSEGELQFTPGNIIAGPKLFFSSAASHLSLDANTTEDVYL